MDMSPFRRLYPFASHFLNIHGYNYHYLDEGRGEPILMLHGNPTWSFFYRELVKAFSPRYRTIVPDHIGCGLSDKPAEHDYAFRLQNRIDDLDRLVRHLDLKEPITLVLHDWGGMIGCAWALANLEKVRRLVVLNTSGFLPPGEKRLPLRLRLIRNFRPFARLTVLGLNLFARAAVYMAPCKHLPRAVRAGLTAPYDSPAHRLATLKFVEDIPLKPGDPSYAVAAETDRQLHRLARLPMLICWGAHDFVFDGDYFNEWRRRFPQAESHWLESAGHYLLEDVPETIVCLMTDFFNRYPMTP
jgi:pimeloyl-ACP methyl ester carboxylesterase